MVVFDIFFPVKSSSRICCAALGVVTIARHSLAWQLIFLWRKKDELQEEQLEQWRDFYHALFMFRVEAFLLAKFFNISQ
jgi:hypothetical protein